MLRSGVILLVLGIAVFLAASVQVYFVRAGNPARGERDLERKPLF